MKRHSHTDPRILGSVKKAAAAAASLSIAAGLLAPQTVLAQSQPTAAAIPHAAFAGTGTQTDPYRIETVQDLASLASLSNSDAAYASASYLLQADLDCTGIPIASIGRTNHFSGVFDGGGHKLFNLTIAEGDQTGLFSFVDGGTVKNLGLENASVSGGANTGMLIGRTMHAVVTNCYASGTVSGNHDVGGLIGMTNNTFVSNCFALGTVNCSGVSAGGLLGSINRSIDPSSDARITNCYALADVTGTNHVGAIIGYDESAAPAYFTTMSNLFGKGGMNLDGNNPDREGLQALSLDEMKDGTLTDLLNAGLQEDWSEWTSREDGLPGLFEARDVCGLYGKGTALSPWRITDGDDLVLMSSLIEQDEAFADDFYVLSADINMEGKNFTPIGRTNHFSGSFDGRNFTISHLSISTSEDLAGLFGFIENGTVKNVGIESGSITGTSRVGGLAGRTMKAQILNSYSKADVSGTHDVGGLVGMFNNTKIRNCFTSGSISGSDRSIGGIAGSANRSLAPETPASIENTYSAAQVSGSLYTGSVIGYDEQGDGFEITLQDVYAQSGTTPSPRVDRTEVTLLDADSMRNGTLIGLLNANLQEGDREWLEENSGYPGFHGKVYIATTLQGEGSEENPYLIGSGDDLIEMNRIVSLSKEKAEAFYALANSVDLEGKTFNGIEGRFYGHFNGNGFALRNLAISNPDKANTGLFHLLEGATVENVVLESGEIFGNRIAGGIAGTAQNSLIKNCMVYAKVRSFDTAGGIAGSMDSTSIVSCAANGKVQSTANLGGIAGQITAPADGETLSVIADSYVMGHPFWGTNAGKVAGNVAAGSCTFDHVYYSDYYRPNIAIGTDFANSTEGITLKSQQEMQSAAFVQELNAGLSQEGTTWVLGEDGKPRLDLFEEAAAIDQFIFSIKDQPEVREGKIVLPVSEDGAYKAVLAGSDNLATVDLQGNVYTPLRDQKVLLIYDIHDAKTGEKKGRVERNIVLDVKGTYHNEGAHAAPMVIPGLREWHGEEGYFTLKEGAGIAAKKAEEKEAAGKILDYLNEICPFDLAVKDTAEEGDIVLHLDAARKGELQSEGYAMEIGDQIVITAADPTGLLYGGISIAQILYQDPAHTTIEKGEVRDYPSDELRGGMFEVARKYFELDYIEEIGKYMAWFKMNTLHLHLNETGGEHPASFVLESEKYPQINDNNTGYIWSKNDYRQMQKDLNAYGVKVISEIDTPGHSAVFAKIAPELVSGADLRLGDHYDECLALIESVFDEYLDGDDPVFQNAIVNIGTDESGNTKENMRRYINDLAQYCLSKDNVDKVEFWGNLSLYYGNTEVKPENVIERIWDGPDQRVDDALENGYLVTNSTSNMMYIVPGRGLGFFSGYLELDKFYEQWKGSSDFTTTRIPNPYWINGKNYYSDYTLLKGDPQILGSFFCDWNDAGWGNDYDIFEIMMPYIGAMAEKGWYGEEARFASGKDFADAFETLCDTGIISNPRRHYADEEYTLADFDFGKTKDGIVSGSILDRTASVENAEVTTVEKNDESTDVLVLHPNTSITLPFDGVGYPYTATMEMYLNGTQAEDAILFQDDFGVFYANYKGQGAAFRMGKYTYSFNVQLPENEWFTLSLTSNYVPGGSPATILKLNGRDYACRQIEKVATNTNGVPSSYLPTETAFTGLDGYLHRLTIRNAWNLLPNVNYHFDGRGTEASPYRISTAAELQRMLDYCGTGNTEGVHFALYEDIDLEGRTLIPGSDFKGVFDGNGHVISHMTIDRGDQDDVGLFGQLNGGTIRNLRFTDASVTGARHAGVVAGRTGSHALIENVRVSGTVAAAADGGLVVGMFNNGTLRNCGSTGSVSVSAESVGGLTGSANLSLDPSTPTVFENCWSAASVTGRYAGRITGWDESTAETLPIDMTNVYYLEGNEPSGNYKRTQGLKSFTQAALTDGTLLALLNGNVSEGMQVWVAGTDGMPDFEVIPEAPASSKMLLQMAIAQADLLVEQGVKEHLNVLVKARFEAALEQAKAVYADETASQFAVNSAWIELSQAIQMLNFTSDFTELDALIAAAQAIDLSQYEEEGKDAFNAALAKALEVRSSDTALDEISIAQAIEALQAAMDALIPVQNDVDLSLLQFVYDSVKDLNPADYLEAGVPEFQEALAAAKAQLDAPESQAAVDQAAMTLHNAWLNLRLRPDEALLQALADFAAQIDNLDPAAYTPAVWNRISSKRQEIGRLLANPNADQAAAENLAATLPAIQELIDHPNAKTAVSSSVSKGTNSTSKSVKTGLFASLPAGTAALSLLGMLGLKRKNRKK